MKIRNSFSSSSFFSSSLLSPRCLSRYVPSEYVHCSLLDLLSTSFPSLLQVSFPSLNEGWLYVCLNLSPQLVKSREWHPARDWCSGSADIIESLERESVGNIAFPQKERLSLRHRAQAPGVWAGVTCWELVPGELSLSRYCVKVPAVSV